MTGHPSSLTATVVANIRALRKARGWSGHDLADQLAPHGVSLGSWSVLRNWENGRRAAVSVDELAALAQVFSVADPWALTSVLCSNCRGFPAPGYACLACGTKGGAP